MLNGLDLFSGIGGLTKALMPWVSPIAYCEKERYAQAVLLSRQATKDLPYAPIWDDICTLRAADLPVAPSIILGGFPCQDISAAKQTGKGLEGKKSGLFFEIMRLVDEARPEFLFLENVPNILTRGGYEVAAEITARGYDSRWCIISAKDCGAKHLRRRWWLLAHAKGKRKLLGAPVERSSCEPIAEKRNTETTGHSDNSNQGDWETRADKIYRDTYGIPSAVDRIRALGNAVCPLQAREAFMILMGLDSQNSGF